MTMKDATPLHLPMNSPVPSRNPAEAKLLFISVCTNDWSLCPPAFPTCSHAQCQGIWMETALDLCFY